MDNLERQIYEGLHDMDDGFKEAVLKTVRAWRLYEEMRRGQGQE